MLHSAQRSAGASLMATSSLVLVIPGIVRASLSDTESPLTSTQATHLARMLATARTPEHKREGIDAVLAAMYGIARQTDWPLAPIRVQSLGMDASSGYWLHADPVTLEAGRDNVRLVGAVTDLADEETAS